MLPAKLLERPGRDVGVALPDDQARDTLAPEIVRQSEHRAVSDAGVFQENLLDLRGMDVLAAGHDHILLAAADEQVAFLIDASEVTGMDPAIAERFGRFFGIVEIRRDGIWGAPENFAEFAGPERVAGVIGDPWAGSKIDKVAGIEARGFILGGAVAHQVSAGFVPIRKKGKLPHTTVRIAYSLEYGLDEMEMHVDAIKPGERVILVDDLIATGGTAEGAVKLLRQIGANVVAACFIIDLPDLGGAAKLRGDGCAGADADGVRGTLSLQRTFVTRVVCSGRAPQCFTSRHPCSIRPSSSSRKPK